MSSYGRAVPRPNAWTAHSSRLIVGTIAALLAAVLVIGAASASTPVTVGYRDQSYGGGTFRPSADKTQSKLWYTDGSWFAGMFLYRTSPLPAKSEYHIYRLDRTTHDWVDTGTVIDDRDQSHGDYLWDEGTRTLWVASAHDGAGGVNDATKVYRYGYDPATDKFTPATGFPVTIPGTSGTRMVTITRDSAGWLWAVWPSGSEVRYSVSSNQGATWSAAVQVPPQNGNPISSALGVSADTASVIAFGSKVGVAWSDHDALPTAADHGFYFATINAGTDPANAGNWSAAAKLPTLVPGTTPTETADNHINLKATADGRVYMVGKTGKDTAECATNKSAPLITLFERSVAGDWSKHLVGTVGDCHTRPQVLISDELETAFVVATAPNGGGAIYLKSAPLSGPEAFKFRAAAADVVERGVPIILSTTETVIDDVTTTKQPVTGASDIVVLANNLTNTQSNNQKYYLHNEWPIGASDSAAPTGTVSIAGGAAATVSSSVSVAVPATDAGSGVAFVRLSDSSSTTNGVLSSGQTFAYRTPITWSLPAGDGTRTVHAQWRDGAGHWSSVQQDSILVDATAPTGSVVIAGGATATASRAVTLTLASSDGIGTGVTHALISATADFAAPTTVPMAASVPWTLPAGDGTKTVYVRFRDALGTTSPSKTDSIALDQTPPAAGTVSIDGGALSTSTTAVTLAMAGAGGDATAARASNQADMTGAISVPTSGSVAWTATAGVDGIRTVYVQWADALGNWSAPKSDSIFLDTVPPTGSLAIDAGAAWTKTTAASLTFPGTNTDVTLVRVGGAADLSAVAYGAYTPGMTLPFTLPGGDGQKTVYAQFKDVGGRESTVVSDTIGLDTTRPGTPGVPVHKLGGTVTTGIATRISWAAGADALSGVKEYVVQRSINGGAYATVATTETRSAVFQLASGKTYKFRVATRDRAGNQSTYRAGPRFTTRNVRETSASVTYRGKWALLKSTKFARGAAKASSVRGASATLRFTGNRVAWVSRRGPTQGTARVYINGRLVAKVNLKASTTSYRQIVFSRSWSTVATRSLKVVVTGSLGRRVVVDQFFVLR